MINYKIVSLPLIIFLMLILGCLRNNIDETPTSELEIITVPLKYDDILFDQDYVKSIRFLPLETTKECLISKITHIIHQGDKFYIFDLSMKSLLIFDNKGNYISKINSVGRGPGEYSELRDFKVDEKGNIFILTNRKILIYSESGQYLRSITFDFVKDTGEKLFPLQFALSEDGGFYLWQGTFGVRNVDNEELYSMCRVNEKMKITNKYFKIVRPIQGMVNRFYGDKNTYRMQSVRGNDTIYKITPKGLFASYYIDFGERKIPSDYFPELFEGIGKIYQKVKKETNYSTLIVPYAETEKYLYFEFQSESMWMHALYSKTTKEVIVGQRNYTNVYSSIIRCNFNDMLVTTIEPYRILSDDFFYKESKYDIAIINEESLRNIKPTDNPVLVFFDLK